MNVRWLWRPFVLAISRVQQEASRQVDALQASLRMVQMSKFHMGVNEIDYAMFSFGVNNLG